MHTLFLAGVGGEMGGLGGAAQSYEERFVLNFEPQKYIVQKIKHLVK